jgi:hypothetical protein
MGQRAPSSTVPALLPSPYPRAPGDPLTFVPEQLHLFQHCLEGATARILKLLLALCTTNVAVVEGPSAVSKRAPSQGLKGLRGARFGAGRGRHEAGVSLSPISCGMLLRGAQAPRLPGSCPPAELVAPARAPPRTHRRHRREASCTPVAAPCGQEPAPGGQTGRLSAPTQCVRPAYVQGCRRGVWRTGRRATPLSTEPARPPPPAGPTALSPPDARPVAHQGHHPCPLSSARRAPIPALNNHLWHPRLGG